MIAVKFDEKDIKITFLIGFTLGVGIVLLVGALKVLFS